MLKSGYRGIVAVYPFDNQPPRLNSQTAIGKARSPAVGNLVNNTQNRTEGGNRQEWCPDEANQRNDSWYKPGHIKNRPQQRAFTAGINPGPRRNAQSWSATRIDSESLTKRIASFAVMPHLLRIHLFRLLLVITERSANTPITMVDASNTLDATNQ